MLSILIMLTFAFNVFQQVQSSYKAVCTSAFSNDQRLLQVVSKQIQQAFLGIDNTLDRAVRSQYPSEKESNNYVSYATRAIQGMVNESQFAAAIFMVNEEGQVIMAAHKKGYEHWIDYTYSFARDNAFMQMKSGKSERFVTLFSGENDPDHRLILVAHKFQHNNGSFAGAYMAAVNPQSFVNYFKIVEQEKNSYISIQMADQEAIAGDVKEWQAKYQELNSKVYASVHNNAEKEDNAVSSYRTNEGLQIYGFTSVKYLPFIITIVLDEKDYLKNWYENRSKDYEFLGVFIAFGSLLSFLVLTMARQIVRVEKSEAAAVLASQAKSEFLANMSHELRTPLNAIIGFSEMMNSGYFGQLNPKQKERIHDINLCGSHLLNLITDILEFSKGDAGKLELAEEKVLMRDIVDEVLRIVHEKIKSKHIQVLTEMEEKIPAIMGDKRKIRQILLNLMSNSIKFTAEQGIIKILVGQEANDNITMTVSDTGIGIAEKDIPIALSVFGQVHRSQSHEGTGLGLPICKMFAELHGGRLAFGSKLGEGTTVRITFPAARNIKEA